MKEKRASGVVIGDDVSGTARPTGREPLTARKHLVSFVLHPDFDMQDLRLPMSIFEAANRLAGGRFEYRSQYTSDIGGPVSSSCGLTVATDRFEPKHVETVLFVGSTTGHDKGNLRQAGGLAQLPDVLEDRETRAGSVGNGTFALAATGLLDGRIAASASKDARELQRQFPKVKVVCSEGFTRDGPVWTSPNISAATGMILAMVEEDNGEYLSNAVAQSLIAYRPRVRKHPCSLLNETHG